MPQAHACRRQDADHQPVHQARVCGQQVFRWLLCLAAVSAAVPGERSDSKAQGNPGLAGRLFVTVGQPGRRVGGRGRCKTTILRTPRHAPAC
jgi:hypothetical protein